MEKYDVGLGLAFRISKNKRDSLERLRFPVRKYQPVRPGISAAKQSSRADRGRNFVERERDEGPLVREKLK